MEILSSSPRPGITVGVARREKKKLKTEEKRAVRVVVLPIFWEQNPEETQAIKETAEEVASMLQAALGVRVVKDDNNDYTPGERMRHWEELKVPVRVEIGPNDVKRRSAVVALAGEAGTVAKKKTLSMGKAMVKHIRSLLAGMGIECKKEEIDKKEEEKEEEEEEEEEEEDEDDEEEEAGGDAAVAAVSHGGDDMDDFQLEVVDPEEEALTMTRVDIAKKKRKGEREKKKEEKRAEREGKGQGKGEGKEKEKEGWEEPEKKKKKTKVVKF